MARNSTSRFHVAISRPCFCCNKSSVMFPAVCDRTHGQLLQSRGSKSAYMTAEESTRTFGGPAHEYNSHLQARSTTHRSIVSPDSWRVVQREYMDRAASRAHAFIRHLGRPNPNPRTRALVGLIFTLYILGMYYDGFEATIGFLGPTRCQKSFSLIQFVCSVWKDAVKPRKLIFHKNHALTWTEM